MTSLLRRVQWIASSDGDSDSGERGRPDKHIPGFVLLDRDPCRTTHPTPNRLQAISQEAERETRSAATGTVALPKICGPARGPTKNVETP